MLRSRTYYGLTNERVIIISGLSSRTVKSLQVQTLTDVSLSEDASGTGTVTFGPNMSYSGRGSSAGRNPQPSLRVDCRRTGSVRTDLLGPEGSVKSEIGARPSFGGRALPEGRAGSDRRTVEGD